jgi:hypothetical protein
MFESSKISLMLAFGTGAVEAAAAVASAVLAASALIVSIAAYRRSNRASDQSEEAAIQSAAALTRLVELREQERALAATPTPAVLQVVAAAYGSMPRFRISVVNIGPGDVQILRARMASRVGVANPSPGSGEGSTDGLHVAAGMRHELFTILKPFGTMKVDLSWRDATGEYERTFTPVIA